MFNNLIFFYYFIILFSISSSFHLSNRFTSSSFKLFNYIDEIRNGVNIEIGNEIYSFFFFYLL